MSKRADICDFLSEGSEFPLMTKGANLDWLDVSEADYRAQETLPKQNLHFMPELEAAWLEGRASDLVPNKDYHPAKVVLDTKVDYAGIARTARMALYSGGDVIQALTSTYDKASLRSARQVILDTLGEKGLLGPFYVHASDFEVSPGKYNQALIRDLAANTKFVLGKVACGGSCLHVGDTACGPFNKPMVSDIGVAYTDAVASQVEYEQRGYGKQVQASQATPKERIRRANLSLKAPEASRDAVKPVVNPATFLTTPKKARVHLPVLSNEAANLERVSKYGSSLAKTGFEVLELIKSELLKGASEDQLLTTMKVGFSKSDLRDTRPMWEALYREAGIYGTVYSTQESFDSCRAGAEFLDKHHSPVATIVSGSKCEECPSNRLGHCAEYNRPLSASVEAAITPQAVSKVARVKVASVPEGDLRSQLKALYRISSRVDPRVEMKTFNSAYTGFKSEYYANPEPVVRLAKLYLNSGLFGTSLLKALKQKFDPRDISAATNDLRPILAEQGLQGVYYVDPTVYSDYGTGCQEGSRALTANQAPFVKVASACGSCTLKKGSQCVMYDRQLVVEPPYTDKRAQQREVLASRKPAQAAQETNLVEEFGLKASSSFELDTESVTPGFELQLGNYKF